MDFNGKNILVTGATSGIGEAISIDLCRSGASVILVGRDQEKLEKTRQRIASQNVKLLNLDLAELETINPKLREYAQKNEPIYGFCHAAGVVETRPLNSFNLDSFQQMMDINVLSGIEIARVVTRRDVISSEGGSLLFITSIYNRIGMPGQIGYSATKGALQSAARAMAIELARRNIKVNTLSPGMVETPMSEVSLAKLSPEQLEKIKQSHPLGFGSPEDVARAALFLLDPANRWITGTEFIIDGGYTAK